MKVFAIIVVVLLFLVLVVLSLYLIVMRVIFHKVFSHKNTLKRLEKNAKYIDLYKIDVCWWDKFKFQTLTTISFDGLKLKGHFYDQNSDYTAIIVHGYSASFKEMQSYAKMFVKMGYNILLSENRGHGDSEGFVGMGWLDKEDVLCWINMLNSKKENQKIVLFGLSMGGSAVCMASGLDLPKNVKGIISDCAFKNVYDQLRDVFNPKHKKLREILLKSFSRYMKRAYDFDLMLADCGVMLKKSKVPILFIHGAEDRYVKKENFYKLCECVPDYRKRAYLFEGADHAMSIVTKSFAYENKVREFLKILEMN